MARFIIENQLNKAEDIKAFNTEGYYFDADNSSAKSWCLNVMSNNPKRG